MSMNKTRSHLLPSEGDLRLGRLAVRANLITEDQLREALSKQAQEMAAGRLHRQLGLILLSRGFLTVENLASLLSEQEMLRSGADAGDVGRNGQAARLFKDQRR